MVTPRTAQLVVIKAGRCRALVKRWDRLAQKCLDDLHQRSNNDDENARLEIPKVQGVQDEELDGPGQGRGDDHDDNNSRAHAHGCLDIFRNTQEGQMPRKRDRTKLSTKIAEKRMINNSFMP